MTIALIILACVLYIISVIALFRRILLAPALSYIGLVTLSLARPDGYPLLPLNTYILIGWFCITLVVTFILILEPAPVRAQLRGMPYMVIGAFAGMAVGLLGFTLTSSVSLLYSIMAIGVVAGTLLGFLLYSRTPEGRPVAPGSGNFFRYLLAKGFPTAITVMMMGVVLVLIIALYSIK